MPVTQLSLPVIVDALASRGPAPNAYHHGRAVAFHRRRIWPHCNANIKIPLLRGIYRDFLFRMLWFSKSMHRIICQP